MCPGRNEVIIITIGPTGAIRPIIIIVRSGCSVRRTGRPVRCMLDRHEDMAITGGRNPFLCRYNVGFDDDGKIRVLDVTVYNNAGSSRDLSAGVSELISSALLLFRRKHIFYF